MRRHLLTIGLLTSACIPAYATKKPKPTPAPPAPLPPALSSAKSVFIANLCPYSQGYSVCADVYNDLFAGIAKIGKYSIVTSPSEADLILQMKGRTRTTPSVIFSGQIETDSNTFFEITIVDRKTSTPLWLISEEEVRNQSVSEALLDDLEQVSKAGAVATVAPPPPARVSQEPTKPKKN